MKLELYYKESCPYCQKVLRFMEMNNIKGVELKDIVSNPENRDKLIEVGGKGQVPCLFIDSKPMYESMDIINFLKENIIK